MLSERLASAGRIIRDCAHPKAAAKGILLEEYRRGGGVAGRDVAASAAFEELRSFVVQTLYELECTGMLPGGALAAVEIEQERQEALRECGSRMRDGIAGWLRSRGADLSDPDNRWRLSCEIQALDGKRYLGSHRRFVPGIGYAVSVRKRESENQDSFLLCGAPEEPVLALADGCSSTPFASIASHLSAIESSIGELSRERICAISAMVSMMLNEGDMQDAGLRDGYGGSSTLLAARINGGRGRLLRVGDSIAFRSPGVGGIRAETLALETELITAIGQPFLRPESVEEFEWSGGRLILTSDGITNYLLNAREEIGRIASSCGDAVFIAERIIRSVLRNQMEWGHCDDATIVVQDIR